MSFVHDPITERIGKNPYFGVGTSMWSEQSIKFGESIKPRPGDIIVATAPKTGTTLLQWMCHVLRTRFRPDKLLEGVDDLYQVSPWLCCLYDLDLDIYEDVPPRIFKLHQRLSAVNRGCKNKGVLSDETLKEFATLGHTRMARQYGANIWQYYVEYWKCIDVENVLVIEFDELVRNKIETIRLLDAFIGTQHVTTPEEDDAWYAEVAAKTSKEFMLEHGNVFDESWSHERAVRLGRMAKPKALTPAARVTKGHSLEFDEETRSTYARLWTEHVTPLTGHATYEAMAQAVVDHMHRRRV